MRKKAELLLAAQYCEKPHAEDCTHYGDRIEIRRLWAHASDPESMSLYGASQVFAIEREVIPTGKTFKASKEICYAITSTQSLLDREHNAEVLLQTFRGHWSVESKNHYRRDITVLPTLRPYLPYLLLRITMTATITDNDTEIILCPTRFPLSSPPSSTDHPTLNTRYRETHTRGVRPCDHTRGVRPCDSI